MGAQHVVHHTTTPKIALVSHEVVDEVVARQKAVARKAVAASFAVVTGWLMGRTLMKKRITQPSGKTKTGRNKWPGFRHQPRFRNMV